MADLSIESFERVSALVDGQLQGDEFAQTLADLESSGEARTNWDTYHCLGEVMRSGQELVQAHDPDFVRRLRQRMAQDTIELVAVDALEIRSGGQKDLKLTSANESWWRRAAGFAAVAMVGVLAWQGLHWSSASDPFATPQLAQQPAVSSRSAAVLADAHTPTAAQVLLRSDGSSALAMSSEPLVMLRDPQLDAFLAAHRQFGGASALQTPAGFLRNANFEEDPR